MEGKNLGSSPCNESHVKYGVASSPSIHCLFRVIPLMAVRCLEEATGEDRTRMRLGSLWSENKSRTEEDTSTTAIIHLSLGPDALARSQICR